MSATAGKVALVRTAAALTGACPSSGNVADLIGSGAASCAETSPTAMLSNTTAALRLQGGTTDTDNNSADFVILAPTPRNCTLITAPAGADVVISQVYGGGGNSGADSATTSSSCATVRRSTSASPAGRCNTRPPSGTLLGRDGADRHHSGGRLLPRSGGGRTPAARVPLPRRTPIGTLAMSATSGKVALVAGATLLTGACPPAGALDFVGYGAATASRAPAAAPTLSNTTAAIRLDGGLVDTNDNAADFAAGAPSPEGDAGRASDGVGAAHPASVVSGGARRFSP